MYPACFARPPDSGHPAPGPASAPARATPCPAHAEEQPHRWRAELPADWQTQVVPPLRFEVQQDGGVLADRVDGRDAQGAFCYFAYRYVRTQLRTDDDESFYEAPVYIETLTAWRLLDGQWLHLRQTVSDCDRGVAQRALFVSGQRPR